MACDIDTLLADAKCFYDLQPFMLDVIRTALLCNISQAISGGSGPGFLSGHGDPEGVVTGLIAGQTYLNLDNGATFWFAGAPGNNTGWNG